MARNIVIYQDEGVWDFGVKCLEKFFREDDVWLATAEAVIDGRVLGMADLFVMPGGADLPYCAKLNGAGNENIRSYVEDGGTYLGVCAGAYYGCKAIEYHKGRPDEICQKRELAFLPATAVGSIHELAKPYDKTLDSAAIVTLQGAGEYDTYYHGSPYFRLHDKNTEIIARYKNLPFDAPAIIRGSVGNGIAILCGVHFEIGPEELREYKDEPDRAAFLSGQFEQRPDWRSILFATEGYS